MPPNILGTKVELNKTPQVVFSGSALGTVCLTSSSFHKYRLDYLVFVWPFNSWMSPSPGPAGMLICPSCWQ